MIESGSWVKSFDQEISERPEIIWKVITDVSRWNLWNAGVIAIEIEGPFASGTWFAMTLPNNEVLRAKLIDVQEPLHFVDETWIGETVVWVEHRIDFLAMQRCRVTFTAKAEGPEATAIGEGVTADFPEVLAELAKYIEARFSNEGQEKSS